MSSRALRRLKGQQRGQEGLNPEALNLSTPPGPEADVEEKEGEGQDEVLQPTKTNRKAKKKKSQRNVTNIYELIGEADDDGEAAASDAEAAAAPDDPDAPEGEKQSAEHEDHDPDHDTDDKRAACAERTKKKRRKKKKKKASGGDAELAEVGDDLEALLERMQDRNGLEHQTDGGGLDPRPALHVEHRNLNPETELKRYFGARAVLGDQRPRPRQRPLHRSTWMTAPKDTWPRYSRPGVSMALLESKDGLQYFSFQHNRDYQQLQFKFLDAVESMDPNNIVMLLQLNPFHTDSLLQLSDVCRMQEDQEMARDLIERALYSFECVFHPVFSLTSGTCRLDYRRAENRAFYLALFKHMMFLEQRGCPRTALEYCKLILSLDPDNDPLCMLLLLDFLCLRCREYGLLQRLYEEWEAHRNLSQLPNFALSTALSCYWLSQQEEVGPEEQHRLQLKADQLLQQSLLMFPSVLMPLLEKCTVQPDAAVSSHAFFGPKCRFGQPPALELLLALYVGRCHAVWKEGPVLLWLETNVREVLRCVDEGDPLVEDCQNKRRQRYQSAPRNIHRHVILSEIREATSALPLDVTTQPVMGFDPLPPLDSVVSYTRPERQRAAGASSESTLSLFFRSLLPNFNLQGPQRPEDDLEVARAGRELNQEVNRLMVAMRDMLANIQFQEPPREDNPDRDDAEWD